jgi:putative serine protease PepD
MNERRKTYVIVAAISLVALLLGCILGAAAGGVAGFLIGRHRGETTIQRGMGDMPWMEQMPGAQPRFGVEGALVVTLVPGTPAANAGLQEGDIITAIDRTSIDDSHNLTDVIQQYQPGDRVTVQFLRNGAEQTVRVELGTNPDNAGQPYLGIYYRTLSGMNLNAPND